MGKRKHEEGDITDSSTTTAEPITKSANVGFNKNDEYDIWLVYKPETIPTDVLEKIKFPKTIREKSTILDCKEDGEDISYKCDFKVLEDQCCLLEKHRIPEKERVCNGIKVRRQIEGIVNISRMSSLFDGYPLPPEEDFNNLNEKVEGVSFPFTIKKINKKPKLKLGHLKQRYHAFGSITKKQKRRKKVQ